jgi:membrane-associated phospholipid phosphatase
VTLRPAWRPLAIGFAISAAALLVFGKIADSMREQDMLAALDRRVAELLHGWVTPHGTDLFLAVTTAGSPVTLGIIGVAVAAGLFLSRRRALLAAWVAALLGAALLDWGLKLFFHRPRPEEAWRYLNGESWSFPSGHVVGSVVTYGMLAYLAVRLVKLVPLRVLSVVVAALVVFEVAFSRLYLGVHFFSDVIGGFAAGIVWLSACIAAAEEMRRREPAGNHVR